LFQPAHQRHIDAVLFWKVLDSKKPSLEVADYQAAISWAQTALRDVIGKTLLAEMLEGRDKISELLRKIIDSSLGIRKDRRQKSSRKPSGPIGTIR
jgi:hypothetical protein